MHLRLLAITFFPLDQSTRSLRRSKEQRFLPLMVFSASICHHFFHTCQGIENEHAISRFRQHRVCLARTAISHFKMELQRPQSPFSDRLCLLYNNITARKNPDQKPSLWISKCSDFVNSENPPTSRSLRIPIRSLPNSPSTSPMHPRAIIRLAKNGAKGLPPRGLNLRSQMFASLGSNRLSYKFIFLLFNIEKSCYTPFDSSRQGDHFVCQHLSSICTR